MRKALGSILDQCPRSIPFSLILVLFFALSWFSLMVSYGFIDLRYGYVALSVIGKGEWLGYRS